MSNIEVDATFSDGVTRKVFDELVVKTNTYRLTESGTESKYYEVGEWTFEDDMTVDDHWESIRSNLAMIHFLENKENESTD